LGAVAEQPSPGAAEHSSDDDDVTINLRLKPGDICRHGDYGCGLKINVNGACKKGCESKAIRDAFGKSPTP
jgi:hypothetical protein